MPLFYEYYNVDYADVLNPSLGSLYSSPHSDQDKRCLRSTDQSGSSILECFFLFPFGFLDDAAVVIQLFLWVTCAKILEVNSSQDTGME